MILDEKKYKIVGRYCDEMELAIYAKAETYLEAWQAQAEAEDEGWYDVEIKELTR